MGLFKKLKKAVKGVFSGIGNVFKKVLKPFQKILSSKWGKILMIAASIFTLGTAMMAGYTAWTQAGGNMLAKFVASGKDFIFSLIGKQTVYGAKGSLAAGKAAAEAGKAGIGAGDALGDPLAAAGVEAEGLQSGLTGTGESLTGELTSSVSNINAPVDLTGSAAGALDPSALGSLQGGVTGSTGGPGAGPVFSGWESAGQGVAKGGEIAKTVAEQAEGSGMFSKAGDWLAKKGVPGGETVGKGLQGVSNFASTPGGGAIFGNVIGGLGEGMMAKEALEDERRERRKYNQAWSDYDWDSVDFDVTSDIGKKPIGRRRTYESGIRMGVTGG